MLSIQYFLRLGSSPSNLAYNAVFSPKFEASFSSKPNQIPTLGIRIAPELEKIGFKLNTVSRLSVPATPPWLLRCPDIDLTLHSSDKAVTPPEVFKVRFYELCDRFKISIISIPTVLKWATEFRQPYAINAVRQLLPDAISIFNVELHAVLLALDVIRRSKEKHSLAVRLIFKSDCAGRKSC